jgi:hypothetical protein
MSEIFTSLSQGLKDVFPPIFWAFLVSFFGWFIAEVLGSFATRLLKGIRLNQVLKGMGWEEALSRLNIKPDAERFFGAVVKWFFVILFLMISFEILGLKQFSGFLEKVIGYYSNIFICCLLFLVSIFLSGFSKKIVIGTMEREKISYSNFLGRAISGAIWTLAILAILYQLRIVPDLILTIFIGAVMTFSITIGIAFGLGGKDLAARILKELEEKLK